MEDIFLKTRRTLPFYKIEKSETNIGKVILPFRCLKLLNLRVEAIKYIRLGKNKIEVENVVGNNISNIVIGDDIFKKLNFPIQKKWQVKVENRDTLVFGPLIGMLVTKNKINNLTTVPEAFAYSLLFEANTGGCVFIFGLDDVDEEKRLVKGYTLDNYNKDTTKKYLLPLPDVVYRRVGLSPENLKKTERIFKEDFFNSYYFSKTEFYNYLKDATRIREHLPKTESLSSLTAFMNFLIKYKKVIIKPNKGTKGRGVRKISILNSKTFIWQDDQAKVRKLKVDFENLKKRIEEICKTNSYIMQNCIESIRTNNRTIDFRVIMQKNSIPRWDEYYILAYDGPIGGVGSNHPDEGHLYSFNKLLQKIGVYERRKKQWIYDNLIRVCKMCCEELDKYGHYADLGIDVLIDKDYKIWIIEVNKRHDVTLPLLIGDKKAYKKIRETPIAYATEYSGFTVINKK